MACTSARRKPTNSPRRSPSRLSASTMNRSRADRHAASRARTSSSDAVGVDALRRLDPMPRLAAWTPPFPIRGAAHADTSGRRSAHTRPTANPMARSPTETACLANSLTAANTAFTRRGPRVRTAPSGRADGTLVNQVINHPSRRPPSGQSTPVSAHHVRNRAMLVAYAWVVDSAPSRPNRTNCKNASAWDGDAVRRPAPSNTERQTASAPRTPASPDLPHRPNRNTGRIRRGTDSHL